MFFKIMKRSEEKNKQKINGHAPLVNGFANEHDHSAKQAADLREEINARSRIAGPYHHTRFVPVQGPGREEMDRIQTPRRIHQPRNINLYDDNSESGSSNRSYTSEEYFDEHELTANLKATLGGEMWSNRKIEENWRAQQRSAEARKEEKPKETQPNPEVFRKNLLMRTLVQQRAEVNSDTAIHFNRQPENVCENSCNFNLVPDSIEPDFFYRKIQNSRLDEDFIVEHIGKVTTVTPRQFLIHNIEPSDFEFCRKKKH